MAIINHAKNALVGQYQLYEIWAELQEFLVTYRERPFFLDWHLTGEPRMFHCNFENVDSARYPSVREDRLSKSRVVEP